MMLEEETYEKFGYYPSDLKPKSSKKILAACDDCGKIREIRKGNYHDFCRPCAQKGEKHPFFEKHHSEETKQKIGEARKGTHASDMTKQKMSDMRKGKKHHFYGKHHSEETRQKLSKIQKERFKKDPLERERLQKIGHHQGGKKTKPELIFEEICKRNNLDFHYVGDGSLWIGKNKKLNPDFIEANGKKICVEIMGAYWHSPLLNKKVPERALQPYREKHYKKYKWIPVFIWDTDLLRKDAEQFVLNELQKHKFT